MIYSIDDLLDTFDTLPSYAWPGGYAISYLSKDDYTLCAKCAQTRLDYNHEDTPVAFFVIMVRCDRQTCKECKLEIS